jgi:carbon-monoxide dehydrogenase medium subunit
VSRWRRGARLVNADLPVKPAAFDYVRAESVTQAAALLRRHGDAARLIAGGQSLLPALNLRLAAPALLIDIGRIAALRGIAVLGGVLRIGAATCHADLLHAPPIAQHAPLLAMAAAHIAHPAIRNRGTLGGSLAYADPAAELPACVVALGASIVVESERGERTLPATEFFTGLFATQLAADEVLTRIEIDVTTPGQRVAFHELARRGGDYALVGLAARGNVADGQFSMLHLGYFAVGATPILARNAAAALTGRPVDAAALEQAQAALAADLAPQDDLQASATTRMTLARLLLRRAVADLQERPA